MENKDISTIRSYLEEGKSICPFAKRCTTHYAYDLEDFKPIFSQFASGQAIVIVASIPGTLLSFQQIKHWAQQITIKAIRQAAIVSYPDEIEADIDKEIDTNIVPILLDDNDIRRPNIALRNEAVITICMAPIYPSTHPRYAPSPILVLTWMADLQAAGVFPKVRAAMAKEHGHVYDALELMLSLPQI